MIHTPTSPNNRIAAVCGNPWFVAVLLVLAVLATYWRVIGGQFVVDDKIWAALPTAKGSFGSLGSIFNSWGFSDTALAVKGPPLFRPLGSLILKLAHGIFGPNPVAFHLLALGNHALNSLLVWRLLGALSPIPVVTRLLCALAFAVHPAVTEAVAWISSIGELQMTTCVLLAMLGYLKWRASGRNVWLVATALLALGGVMIKDGALAFVPLVLALDWCRERTVRWRALAVIGSGTVLYLLWRMLVVGSVAGGKQLNVALDRLVVFAAAHLRYLVIPGQQPFSIAPPEVPVAGMGSLALTFLLVGLLVGWGWRQRPAMQGLLLFGGVWIVITLWPAYAIALVENGFFAGRHCYLPAIGWAIILATVLAELANRVRALPAILACGVLLLAVLSFGAAASWRTDIAVYERSTQLSPNDEGPLAGLADALFTAGDTGRAMTAYQQLATRTPNLQARNTYRYRLAIMSSEKGEYGQSNGYLSEILRQAPDNAAAWTGLGNNAWLAGQEAMAINHYRQALKLEPGNQEAQRNLATLLNRAGQNPP